MRLRPIHVAAALALTVALAYQASPATAQRSAAFPAVVTLKTGKVSSTGSAVHTFKGIPFAAPPTGALRWQAPHPAAAWTGVRDGSNFAPDCMQPADPRLRAKQISEDCLYANVWTPAKRSDEKLPVMVFIYGGGFDHGSGSRLDYDGERLAAKGVVFVNFNYRVGIFGFLAHPQLAAESPDHSSGNYALLDQIAALQWVRDNIGAFGGDPRKVMIFGQSAGGSSVELLLISPLAKGLFRAAIAESPGAIQNLPSLTAAEKTGSAFGGDIAALRAMSAEELQKKSTARTPGAEAWRPRPIVDGWIIPRSQQEAYATRQANLVPVIVGNNQNEAGASIPTTSVRTVAAYERYVREHYKKDADKVLAAFPVASDDAAPQAMATLSAASTFGVGVRTSAAEMAADEPSTFRYYFTRHRGSGPNAPIHFEEISYVFGHLDAPSVPGDPAGGHGVMTRPPFDKVDEQLCKTMMDIWVHFAATTDPNGPGLPSWPRYSSPSEQYLEFGDIPHAAPDAHAKQFDILKAAQEDNHP